MRAVNLLPESRRGGPKRRSVGSLLGGGRPLLLAAAVLALAATAAMAVAFTGAQSSTATKQSQLAAVQAKIAAVPKAKPVAPVPGASNATARLSSIRSVAVARVTWDRFFGGVARVIPEDVWILSLVAHAPAAIGAAVPAVGAAPTAFTMTGYTYSQPSVARLMKRLALLPWLSQVSLVTSARSLINQRTVYQFTVSANVVAIQGAGA